jgi:MFS family permease
VIPAVLLHAAVAGGALGVAAVFQWEVIGRGVSESRRGQAFALAFGAGPVLAVLGSLGQQLVLDGHIGPLAIPPLGYPWNFATLFGVSVPLMLLAGFLAGRFIVPQPALEVTRQPFLTGVLGGFGEFLGHRLILITSLAYIAVYSGLLVQPNLTLFTREAIGEAAEEYAGYQNALWFGFKFVAGLALGWLLTRTNPRAGLLATAALALLGVAWPLLPLGKGFLLAFGFLGAAELMGLYYPNYLLCCSPKAKIRRNMAFASLVTMPASLAPLLFGVISDRFGLRPSFVAAAVVVIVALLLVLFLLPARPRPRESDLDV